jgi:hypothetical protein
MPPSPPRDRIDGGTLSDKQTEGMLIGVERFEALAAAVQDKPNAQVPVINGKERRRGLAFGFLRSYFRHYSLLAYANSHRRIDGPARESGSLSSSGRRDCGSVAVRGDKAGVARGFEAQ